MIYKIESEYNEVDFQELMKKLSEQFVFLYISGTLYASLKDIKFLETHKNFLYDCFSFSDTNEITQITPINLKLEAEVIQEWCRDHFVALETQLYEAKEQDRLHNMWDKINELELTLNNAKGGDHIA